MGLRVEEQLGVDDAVRARAGEVGHCQRCKIAAVAEHRAAGVVEVEERLQVGKLVRGADFVDRGIGQGDRVLLREREHQLGLERALDVQVQLDLG